MMLAIYCSGSPREIGLQHGEQASKQIHGSVAFYQNFLTQKCGKSWSEIQETACRFLPYLEDQCLPYVEEIRGVAEGAGVDFETIMVLNVRTEIAYGMQVDGCTAFSMKTKTSSFLAQNWDWSADQIPNIISLHVEQPGKPKIHMMTEAGIIGKIGLNSEGTGVTLNAISAVGVDFQKMPCHLALRTALESTSMPIAREKLISSGVAAACHITIADATTGAVGLECSSEDIVELEMESGRTWHSNHMIKKHRVPDLMLLDDSPFRLSRVQELLQLRHDESQLDDFRSVLKDEMNFPAAICRASKDSSNMQTIFSIVMDLRDLYATVKMGRPTENGEELQLRP